MAPIRILQINNAMVSAGIEAFIMNMYRHIDRDQVQFDFLVHYPIPQFYDEEIKRLGGKIYYLSIRKDNNFIKYFKELDTFFKEHKEYHVIHGHMDFYGVFYLFFAKKNGVKIRLIHSHNASISPTLKGIVNYVLDIPLKYMTSYRYACSEKAGKFLYKKKPFKVINNAIEVERFSFDPQKREELRTLHQAKDKCVYVSIGRFEKQKNHHFMLQVFKEITKQDTNAELWLIGRGSLEDKIRNEIKEFGLENTVKILGTQKDIQGYLSAGDVFLMPSLYEGLPVSGVEAQANGIQCFFSDSITQEINISPAAHFISLDKSAKEWADILINSPKEHLLNQEDLIRQNGFDIQEQAKKMQELYKELDKKAQE